MMNRVGTVSVLSLMLIACASMGEETASCRPDFVAAHPYLVSGNVYTLAAADMNGDGRQDLVSTTNNSSFAISIRLGQPDGTLGPQINKATNTYPYGSAVGLFTNDTVPDIVVAGTSGLALYKGNGDGTLQDAVTIDGELYAGVRSGDVNGDGKLDLLAQNYFAGGFRVFLGNGDGTFQPSIPAAADTSASSLVVGDLNGDGFDDVVLPVSFPNPLIFLSNGDGTFAPPSELILGTPGSAVLGDVSQDGILDLLVTYYNGLGRIGVLLGNGDGSFQAPVLYEAGPSPVQISVGDFDGDGLQDLAVANDQAGALWTLKGLGAGIFLPGPAYAANYSTRFSVVADFGGDGAADIATASDYSSDVNVLGGRGDGTFDGIRLSLAPFASTIATQGDFNEDGKPDLALSGGSGGLSVLLGSGDGSFHIGVTYAVGYSYPTSIVAADVNGDGHLDLAVLNNYIARVQVLLGAGDGTFGPPSELEIPTGASNFYFLAAGHFVSTSSVDLAVADQQSGAGGDITVFPGLGDGTFGSPVVTSANQELYTGTAADLNGDGLTDLAVLDGFNFDVEVFLAAGNGIFQPPATYAFGFNSRGPITASLHDGGHLDLVLASDNQPLLEILPGNGDGTFGPPTTLGLGSTVNSVAAADFNGNGKLDLVTANQSGDLSVLYGLGNGAFLTPVNYGSGLGAVVMFTGDYDQNGLVDTGFVTAAIYTMAGTLLNGGLGATVRNASAVVTSPAVLTASASGFGTVTYQWRKGGTPLSDGGTISGVTTPTLTIDPVAFTDAGSYDLVVTDSCGPANSNAAALAVEFDDVPLSNIFHGDIITIATSGITSGCKTGRSYCPSASVSRAEMAVLLLKAKYGADHVPPPPPVDPIFPDVPADAFAAAWIDELASLQITAGCGDGSGNYCPDAPVTRGQMAVFLLKTLLGFDHVPPGATGIFADVPSDYFSIDWIEDLYNRNITAGCNFGPLRYCPDDAVPREQMATFLVRTFSIGP